MSSNLDDIKRKLDECQNHISALRERMASMEGKIDTLIKTTTSNETLLKYVVFPLLIIVGALVGIKLAFP